MYNSFKKNKIGFVLIFVLVLFGFAFASDDDCAFVDAIINSNRIFFEEDIDVAKNHLTSYCCKIKESKKGVEASFGESAYVGDGRCTKEYENGPDSPFWMDHLIDVGIRKLSARELYHGMLAGDAHGVERLQFIEQEKNAPSMLSYKFDDFWRIGFFPDHSYSADKTQIFLLGDGVNLGDKYINLCSVVIYMINSAREDNALDASAYYDKCMRLVRSKMRDEASIAYNISMNAGANMLQRGWDGFLKQFIQNRLMKLQDKILAISQFFDIIQKQAPLSKTCTK